MLLRPLSSAARLISAKRVMPTALRIKYLPVRSVRMPSESSWRTVSLHHFSSLSTVDAESDDELEEYHSVEEHMYDDDHEVPMSVATEESNLNIDATIQKVEVEEVLATYVTSHREASMKSKEEADELTEAAIRNVIKLARRHKITNVTKFANNKNLQVLLANTQAIMGVLHPNVTADILWLFARLKLKSKKRNALVSEAKKQLAAASSTMDAYSLSLSTWALSSLGSLGVMHIAKVKSRIDDLVDALAPAQTSILCLSLAKADYNDKVLFAKFARSIVKQKQLYDCHNINNVLFAFTHLGLFRDELHPEFEELFKELESPAHLELKKFKHYELAGVLWAFASSAAQSNSKKHSDTFKQLFEESAKHIQSHLDKYDMKTLSSFAWSFAAARILNGSLFSEIARKLTSLPKEEVDSLTVSDAANMVWAFSSTGQSKHSTYQVLADSMEKRTSKLTPEELSMTVWGFAKATFKHEKLFKELAELAVPMVNSKSMADFCVANLVWGFSKNGCMTDELYRAVATRVMASAMSIDEQLLPKLAFSMSIPDVIACSPSSQAKPMFNALAQAVLTKFDIMFESHEKPHGLVPLLSAFVAYPPDDKRLAAELLSKLTALFVKRTKDFSLWEIPTILFQLHWAHQKDFINLKEFEEACLKSSSIAMGRLVGGNVKAKTACSLLCSLVKCSPVKLKFEDLFATKAPAIVEQLTKEEISEILIDFCDARVTNKTIYVIFREAAPVYPEHFNFEQRCKLLSVFETVGVPAPNSLINALPLRDSSGNPLLPTFRKLYSMPTYPHNKI